MDVDTAEAVDSLRTDIRRVEHTLTGEIARVEYTLTGEIGRVEKTLTAEIDRVEASLTARMHALNDDTKRHVNVQIESVRDDIRLVAEHLVALGSKVDSLRR